MPDRYFLIDIETEEEKPGYGEHIFYIGVRNFKGQENLFLHHDEVQLFNSFAAWFLAQKQNYDFLIAVNRFDVSLIPNHAICQKLLNPAFDPYTLVDLYHFHHQEIADITKMQIFTLDDLAEELQLSVTNPDRRQAPELWKAKRFQELKTYLRENLWILEQAWLRRDEL